MFELLGTPPADIRHRLPSSPLNSHLVVPTGVDPLDGLGRNVSRPGRLVFHSRHARLDILRHLVWTSHATGWGRSYQTRK